MGGTPAALMGLIVIIETVRNIIRPGTLSIRLAANMVAGHLLLTLLGSQGPGASGAVVVWLILGLTLLIILEVGVACIRAYVFTVLRALYLNEVRSVGFLFLFRQIHPLYKYSLEGLREFLLAEEIKRSVVAQNLVFFCVVGFDQFGCARPSFERDGILYMRRNSPCHRLAHSVRQSKSDSKMG